MPRFSDYAKTRTRNQLGLRIILKTLDIANLRARKKVYAAYQKNGMKQLGKFVKGIDRNEKRATKQLAQMQSQWDKLKSKGKI